MLIVALVMAIIGLAALVTAVVTSNEVIAWVCIGASVIGVVLLIIDALRERQRRDAEGAEETTAGEPAGDTESFDAEYPDDKADDDVSGDAQTQAIPRHESSETATEESGDSGHRSG